MKLLISLGVASVAILGALWRESKFIRLPTIDISCFIEDNCSYEEIASVSASIGVAAEEYGVFYLTGHGINDSSAISLAKSMFKLLDKNETISELFLRGYIPSDAESGSHLTELKEAFGFGMSNNIFPPSLNDISRTSISDLYTQFGGVARVITHALSFTLGQPELVPLCENGDQISLMRAVHYLPLDSQEVNITGSSPHTDWGLITLIIQDQLGLQLKLGDSWKYVPVVPGTIVVNVGDFLSMISNQRYLSPVHRVTLSQTDRYSYVYFYYPNHEATLTDFVGSDKSDYSRFSLFHKQNTGSGQNPLTLEELAQKPFGDIVKEKWSQVQR